MPGTTIGIDAIGVPQHTASREPRVARIAFWLLWCGVLFAPSMMLGFTRSESKVSPAVVFAACYLTWRVLMRPLPRLSNPLFGLCSALVLFLVAQGILLTATTGQIIVLLLQVQWVAYFGAAFLITYDLAAENGAEPWLGTRFVYMAMSAAVLGLISVWTGPFYSYANHSLARWGLPIDRAVGAFESPGMLAGFLAIAFLLLFFAPTARSAWRKVMLSTILVTLLLTQAKGGIFCCLLSLFIGIGTTASTARKRRTIVAKTAVAVAVIAAVMLLANAFDIDIAGLLAFDLQDRGEIRQLVFDKFVKDNVAAQVFGIGFRQSAVIDPDTGMWFTAHNSYVSLLRETGLLGLGLFLTFLAITGLQLIRRKWVNWIFALLALVFLAYTEGYLYASYFCMFVAAVGGLMARMAEFTPQFRLAPSQPDIS